MVALLSLVLNLLISPFKSMSRLEAENAALRWQLAVLQRNSRARVELTNWDRMFFALLYRWFPSILQAMTIVRPETVVRWHRAGLSPLLVLEVARTGRASADPQNCAP